MITIIRAKAYLWWSWSRSPSSLHISSWLPPTSRRPEKNKMTFSLLISINTIANVIIIDHSLATWSYQRTNKPSAPSHLCIFEPALVNNKCLAGSQSSNVAAKSKLARPNLPPGAKIRCKSVAPSPHFCTKTIGGSARPEYFGWKQLRTARAHNYQFWSKSWRRWMLASKYIVLLFFLQGSIKKDIETSSSHFNRE